MTTPQAQIEFFSQQQTDANGQKVLTLSRAPKTNKVLVISSAGVPRVVSVTGRDLTVGVRAQQMPAHNHAASFAGSALGAHNHGADEVPNHTHGSTNCSGGHAAGTCTVPGLAAGAHTPVIQPSTAGTPAGSVTVDNAAAADFANLATTTLDFVVIYDPA